MHCLYSLFNRIKKLSQNNSEIHHLKTKHKTPRAFSLIEISITILIIGVLIAATLSAKAMIKNSRIAAAQAKTRSGPVNSIPNSVIWLESSLEESFQSDEAEDGTNLTGWNDIKSGSASAKNNASAGSNNPIFSNTINSIHAVKFLGDANSYFEIDGSALNDSDYTIIVLEKRQGDGANYFLSDDGTSTADNQRIQLGYSASGTVKHSQGSGNEYSSAVGGYSTSNETPRIFAFIQNESFGKKTYVNGFLAAENTADKTQLSGINKLHLGKNYTGEIGEFLIFDRALKKEERTSIEKYLLDKWRMTNIISGSNSSDCSTGVIKDSGCAALCVVSIAGESTTSLADGASEDFDCDQTGYVDSVSSYTCSGGATISNSCDCDTSNHYSSVAGTCQAQCDLADIAGLASAYVDSGVSSSATCTTGYSGTINYSCSSGTLSVDSGSCISSCTISSETGIADGTIVIAASGTQSCNADGFDDEVTYTCTAGVFEKDSGQECETCAAGYEGATCALSSTPFTSTWDTTKAGTSNSTSITLPLVSSGTYNFLVDWGDGESETITSSSASHDYAATNGGGAGQIVKIYGDITGWRFNDGGDKLKLTNISKWGSLNLGNDNGYFKGCDNLTITATDILDTTGTTTFSGAFQDCDALATIPSLGSWDMTNVTNMSLMFKGSASFNEPSIVNWVPSSVTNATWMFANAESFNQAIGAWNTASLAYAHGIFNGADAFDQDLANWNITGVSDLTYFFTNRPALSAANYNKTLHGWANQTTPQMDVTFSAGDTKYDTSSGSVDGKAARAILTGTYNWTINDGGENIIPISCTGGYEDSSISGYKMHVFTTLGDTEKLDCTAGGSGNAEILVVAGGGGGGGTISGGGGAGGVIYNASYALTNTVHDVVIGDGGIGGNGWDTSQQHGKKGENSEFATLVAIGGGGGSDHRYSSSPLPNEGGSGGGSALHNSDSGTTQDDGYGTSGQGNHGGTCSTHCYDRAGGGGGAGSIGGSASSSASGAGGAGVNYSTNFGTSYGDSGWFASGGSGGVRSGTGSVAGVSAGGGGIGTSTSSKAGDADANTGGGGGGAGFHDFNYGVIGGKGGSGIVIIKYAN